MKKNAQTSDRVSAIAARMSRITAETLMGLCAKPSTAEVLAKDIRTMAASLMRQDETKGLRGIFKKLLGK